MSNQVQVSFVKWDISDAHVLQRKMLHWQDLCSETFIKNEHPNSDIDATTDCLDNMHGSAGASRSGRVFLPASVRTEVCSSFL